MANALFIPKDIKNKMGAFENNIASQHDVTVTNFEKPFESSSDLNRLRNAAWIKSESIGQAFQICYKKRLIVLHAMR